MNNIKEIIFKNIKQDGGGEGNNDEFDEVESNEVESNEGDENEGDENEDKSIKNIWNR